MEFLKTEMIKYPTRYICVESYSIDSEDTFWFENLYLDFFYENRLRTRIRFEKEINQSFGEGYKLTKFNNIIDLLITANKDINDYKAQKDLIEYFFSTNPHTYL